MENRNGKTVVALLTGATIGTVIGLGVGILFAPRKGKKTRKMIKHSVVGTAHDASKWIKNSKDDLAKTVRDKKEVFDQKLEDVVSNMTHKAEDLRNSVEDKVDDIKKKMHA